MSSLISILRSKKDKTEFVAERLALISVEQGGLGKGSTKRKPSTMVGSIPTAADLKNTKSAIQIRTISSGSGANWFDSSPKDLRISLVQR